MRRRSSLAALFLVTVALLLAGCAGTRVAHMGLLPTQESLVTLVVSQDRELIAEECHGALALGPIYGCQSTRVSSMPDGTKVRIVKIVRYTDSLPSKMALEIESHELCHAIASLQAVADPCHVGNNGFLQAAPRAIIRLR